MSIETSASIRTPATNRRLISDGLRRGEEKSSNTSSRRDGCVKVVGYTLDRRRAPVFSSLRSQFAALCTLVSLKLRVFSLCLL